MDTIKPDQLIRKIMSILFHMEMKALRYGHGIGLKCLPVCGDCCRDDHPEDSVLSALPSAQWAIDNDKIDLLAKAALEDPDGQCAFYDHTLEKCCTIYPLRPLICRLFGFAGTRDKYGAVQFRPCRRMPPPKRNIKLIPPIYSDCARQLEYIFPQLGSIRLPLNAAFYQAVQWLLLYRQFDPENPQPYGPSRRYTQSKFRKAA